MQYIKYVIQLVSKVILGQTPKNKTLNFNLNFGGGVQQITQITNRKDKSNEVIEHFKKERLNSKNSIVSDPYRKQKVLGKIKLHPTIFQEVILSSPKELIKIFIDSIVKKGQIDSAFLARDNKLHTVLHYAVCREQSGTEVLAILLEIAKLVSEDFLKEFINIRNIDGKTALHYAKDGIVWQWKSSDELINSMKI